MKHRIGVLIFIFVGSFSLMGEESLTCTNENGTCTIYESGWNECTCGTGDDAPTTGSGSCQPDIACENDSDCPEENLCENGTCVIHMVLTQEKCMELLESSCLPEPEKTVCENPAGKCEFYSPDNFSCECLDGHGEGSSGSSEGSGGSTDPVEPEGDPGKDPVEPPAGDPVEGGSDSSEGEKPVSQEVCLAKLVEVCGEEAPDLKEICSNEMLNLCVDAMDTLTNKCGDYISAKPLSEEEKAKLLKGEWTENGESIASCCRNGSDGKKKLEEVLECLKTKKCEECIERPETGEDTATGGEETNNNEPGSAGDGSSSTDDSEGDGQSSDKGDAAGSVDDSSKTQDAATGGDSTEKSTDNGAEKESGSGCSVLAI